MRAYQCSQTDVQAVADYPAAIFPEELIAAYPGIPVILTKRSTEGAWFSSMSDTLIHMHRARVATAAAATTAATTALREDDQPKEQPQSPMMKLSERYHRYCWGDDFERLGIEAYRKQIETVRRAMGAGGEEDPPDGVERDHPARPYLEYQPGDGWGPLCKFLGVPVPKGEEDGIALPYPRSDDWAEYKKMVQKQKGSSEK